MKRIFLHAGQPKTGTTAIQHFLGENREGLLRLGYLFPEEGLSHIHNHGPLVLDILGDPKAARHEGAAQRLARTLREHPAPNILISAERLYTYFRSCPARGDRNAVIEFFLSTGIRTTVLLYIRDDAARLNSGYIQNVKSFRSDASLRQHVEETIELDASHLRLLDLAVPPQIDLQFRAFGRRVQQGGAVRDFLRAIGLSDEEIATTSAERRVNDSLGPIALEAARQTLAGLRREGRDPTLRQRSALRTALFDLVAAERPEASFYGIDAGLSQLIDRTVRDDRDAFSRAVWGRCWRDVFELEEKPVNVFDPLTAEADDLDHFRRLLDGLRAAAARIMADDGEARPRRPAGQGGRKDPEPANAMLTPGAGEQR